MTRALPEPHAADLLTQWVVQPVALAAVVLLGATYAVLVVRLRRAGTRWPLRRSLYFAAGLALFAWTTCGYLAAYASSVYWAWTGESLVLLLAVPFLLLLGRPLDLLNRRGPGRLHNSRLAHTVRNPLVGPALIPLVSAVLFFGPLPGRAISTPALGWSLHLVLIVLGGIVILPLLGAGDDERSSLAIGLSLAIGSVELVLSALPGVILALHNGVATSFFAFRDLYPWSPTPAHDEQIAGSILGATAGVITMPFVFLVYRRWVRADMRDAAEVDAVLEAERITRASMAGFGPTAQAVAELPDRPWWLNDPAMRDRLRRH